MERTILVVDDDPVVHEVFGILADSEGGVRLTPPAHDGHEAVERASAACPDAMVLDVQMRPIGGLEVLPRLRELCPTTVIVMYSSDPERIRGRELGADAVFDKAADDPGRVLDEIRRMVDERSGSVPRPRSSPERLDDPAAHPEVHGSTA